MDLLSSAFDFFVSNSGLWITGLVAAAMILFWEWRATLVGLVFVQVNLAILAVHLQGVPTEWAVTQTLVVMLACLILALSAQQTLSSASFHQSGTWLLRLMALILLTASWRLLGVNIVLPGLAPSTLQLLTWLALCALILWGLGDNPFFMGVGLLLWSILVQTVVMSLLAIPALVAGIGIVELLLALACSYLILIEQAPQQEERAILTDITFPTSAQMAARSFTPVAGSIGSAPRVGIPTLPLPRPFAEPAGATTGANGEHGVATHDRSKTAEQPALSAGRS
jgi:hypothetical protein